MRYFVFLFSFLSLSIRIKYYWKLRPKSTHKSLGTSVFFPSQTSYSLTIHSKSIVWTQFVSVFVWNVAQTQKKLAHNLQCNKNRQKRTMTNVAVWSNNNCWENLILTPTPYAVLFYMYVCFTHKKWYSQCTFHLNHSFGSHLLFSTFRILRATNHFFWLHTFIRKKFFFDS